MNQLNEPKPDAVDIEMLEKVAHVGELLIRATAVLSDLSPQQRDGLCLVTEGKLPWGVIDALEGAAMLSPQIRDSLKRHPPTGFKISVPKTRQKVEAGSQPETGPGEK